MDLDVGPNEIGVTNVGNAHHTDSCNGIMLVEEVFDLSGDDGVQFVFDDLLDSIGDVNVALE